MDSMQGSSGSHTQEWICGHVEGAARILPIEGEGEPAADGAQQRLQFDKRLRHGDALVNDPAGHRIRGGSSALWPHDAESGQAVHQVVIAAPGGMDEKGRRARRRCPPPRR